MDYIKFSFNNLPPQIGPTLFILNILNTSFTLNDKNQYHSIYSFLLPIFSMTLLSPILANTIHPYFKFTEITVVAFTISLILFFILKRYSQNLLLRRSIEISPFIGKILMLCDMKNSKTPVHVLFLWIIINTLISILVTRLIQKEEMIINEDEIKDMAGTVFCLVLGRYFMFEDIIMSLVVMVMLIIVHYKRETTLKDIAESLSVSLSEEGKTPRKRGRPKKTEDGGNQTPRSSRKRLVFED